MKAAIWVKSPFSHNALFGFIIAFFISRTPRQFDSVETVELRSALPDARPAPAARSKIGHPRSVTAPRSPTSAAGTRPPDGGWATAPHTELYSLSDFRYER